LVTDLFLTCSGCRALFWGPAHRTKLNGHSGQSISNYFGARFALANAIMYGSVTGAVRGMTAPESANTLLMWQMVTKSPNAC
jgi:hypothetical protein